MEVDFDDDSLRRLEADPNFTAGFDAPIVKAFRMRMQLIRAAVDECVFSAMKSLRYEKLKGDRAGQNSMRLNDQWCLILQIRQQNDGKCVVTISIVDTTDPHGRTNA